MELAEEHKSKEISILTSENSKPKSKKLEVQQYFLEAENNDNKEDIIEVQDGNMSCGMTCLVFLILIVIGISILFIKCYIDTSRIQYILFLIFIVFISGFCIVSILKNCSKKHIFSKDIQKNRFYVKKVNFLNRSIIEINSSLGNYYIQCKKEIINFKDKKGSHSHTKYKLYLYNLLIDTSEYDLDTSNVKKVPLKLIHIFSISLFGQNPEYDLEAKLNNFICTKNFNDPYSFDIGAYMGNNENNGSFLFQRVKYIKYSDNFFTFYFSNSKTNPEIIYGAIRLDFIYSEKFDRIFIGIVKSDLISYVKTFEFYMNNIDKFILQKFSNYENGYNLKVMFKDKQIQDIWPIPKRQEDLEGLVYILNERLNNE